MTIAGHWPVVGIKVDGRYEGEARVDVSSGSVLDLHTPFVKRVVLGHLSHTTAGAQRRRPPPTGNPPGRSFVVGP